MDTHRGPARVSGLVTDLYELTMMEAYREEGYRADAVFDVFVRKAPARRNFLVACGIDDALDALESLTFEPHELAYLQDTGLFSTALLDELQRFRFEGAVRAVPEGTVVFAGEPLLEVRAPMPQAQLVEALVLNSIVLPTVVASKTARLVRAARGRPVIDFGLRRAYGIDAALRAARAAYVAGASGTSNVLAGERYGIPIVGTMAHSYVQAHVGEEDAFRAFARVFPGTTLLVDTYDTRAAIRSVVKIARDTPVGGIRLDSGDLEADSKFARTAFEAAGLHGMKIFASGNLDEDRIDALMSAGAPIDAFGVGTQLVAPSDSPNLDAVYKLVEYDGRPVMKLSPGKVTLPAAKQVYRVVADGKAERDIIALEREAPLGVPLLVEAMREGERVLRGSLAEARARAAASIATMPASLLGLEPATYPVVPSAMLDAERQRIEASLRA